MLLVNVAGCKNVVLERKILNGKMLTVNIFQFSAKIGNLAIQYPCKVTIKITIIIYVTKIIILP